MIDEGRFAMKKIAILLGYLLVLMYSSSLAVAQISAEIRKLSPPAQVKTTPTSMHLSASKGKVYLDVKPSPVKLHFYSGKRRLGSMAGRAHQGIKTEIIRLHE